MFLSLFESVMNELHYKNYYTKVKTNSRRNVGYLQNVFCILFCIIHLGLLLSVYFPVYFSHEMTL